MNILRQYISEIVAPGTGYKPVGYHEVSIFYGTAPVAGLSPATAEEQDEFNRLLDVDEDLAYEYLNKWLEGRGLDRLDIVD